MSTHAERIAMIQAIRDLPSRLEALVSDLDDVQLNAPGGEGEWNIRQVVHHVADAHINACTRMKLVLTEENPTFKPYDQEAWAKLPDTAAEPIQPSLWIIRGLHQRWSGLLSSLREEEWQRVGYHPENGTMSLDDLLVTYSGHGENHIRQIKSIRDINHW